MPDRSPVPTETSPVRVGLRLLAWFLPGIAAPGFLLALFALTYGSGTGDWIIYPLFGGLVLLTLGCAFFDSILRIPTKNQSESPNIAYHAKHILIFSLAQIPIIPILGYTVAMGCTAVIRAAN